MANGELSQIITSFSALGLIIGSLGLNGCPKGHAAESNKSPKIETGRQESDSDDFFPKQATTLTKSRETTETD